MRLHAAAVVLMGIASTGAARADIRINESNYSDGTLVISGQTSPNRTVTLDNKYTTKSDGGGAFKFTEHYKPFTCMSDIRTADDVYSAVIAGCLDPGDVEGPVPNAKSTAK